MYFPKNSTSAKCTICTGRVTLIIAMMSALFFCTYCSHFLYANTDLNDKLYIFNCTKGLKIKILKRSDMPFIHAQLVIHYNQNIQNPAIPYLTLLNIFDKRIKNANSNLMSHLKKLGSDFQVEHRPDFLLFKINFLKDKMQLFLKFLNSLFQYKPFLEYYSNNDSYNDRKRKQNTLARFNDSIDNYWVYFFRQKEWKNLLAYQLAYHHFFPNALMGKTFITPDLLEKVKINHIISFYEKTYRLPSSLLIIKGDIENPAILNGHIERTFLMFKKQKPVKIEDEIPRINSQDKIIVFNSDSDMYSTLYWFELVDVAGKINPIISLVLNNMLFSVPKGRIFLNNINQKINRINILGMKTELINHQDFFLISNKIHLNYGDIIKFIRIADRERKKLSISRVDGREFLKTLSSIYKRLKVNTQNYENDVNIEIISNTHFSKKTTLAGFKRKADNQNYVVIIIVGNAEKILKELDVLKSNVEVINFN